MAFFYGLDFILVTSDSTPLDDFYALGNDETTILPGMQHDSTSFISLYIDTLFEGNHFKNGYFTGIIALVLLTWLSLAILYRLTFRLKLSPPSAMPQGQSRAWVRKWNATLLLLPTIVVFLM